MKKVSLFTIMSLLTVVSLFGATDKYRLIITDDPATTMTIGWNQISGHSVAVFYDVVDHGTDLNAYANFQLPDRTVVHQAMNNYFVRLKDLEPSTAYYFVISDSEGHSERFWFRTLSDNPEVPLSVVAGGDSRRSGDETTPHEPRIQSNQMVAAIRPDFVAFGGDYTDKNTEGQWMTWFDDWQYTTGNDGLMIPILPTRGNHEYSNLDVVNLFDCQFDDVYYAINFGGSLVRFYTLNSMMSVAGDQTNWLQQDLEANEAATVWKLAQYHYTIAPHTASKPYRVAQYTHWAPLFHEFGLQLIIECDTHVARNSWPLRPSNEANSDGGFIRDDNTGSVYCGEGSWGLTRSANVEYNWTRDKGSFTQVKWLKISMDSIVVHTIKSASSTPVAPVDDNNRFEMPEGMDTWVTNNGDRVLIERPNPLYEGPTSTLEVAPAPKSNLVEILFPNPASAELQVVMRQMGDYQFEVFDIEGKIMQTGQFLNLGNRLDIAGLSRGVYYLKVWNENTSELEVTRFIK
ncbi:MAG: fibronectin type III domain-containing protein, partial [Bacteroidota bacterium]